MSSIRSDLSHRAPTGRIPGLDGLRGIAIALVLLYHYFSVPLVGESNRLVAAFQSFVGIGWCGVDLFFVLSGFLIGGILLDARDSPRYFKTFYGRRFFRIIPLYYLWITLYLVLAAGGMGPFLNSIAEMKEKWTVVLPYYLFLQNMTKNLSSVFGTAWLGHLWSLAVEEQFYLIIPFAIRYLPRKRLVQVLLATIPGAVIVRIIVFKSSTTHFIQYMLTPCRADALAFGVLLAVLWRSDYWKGWIAGYRILLFWTALFLLGGIAYLACTQPSPYSFAMSVWGYSCIGLFFSCLLATVLAFPQSVIGKICRVRILRELGRVSYCVYVIHQVVQLVCGKLLFGEPVQASLWHGSVVGVAAICASYGIAWCSWKFFENPLLERGRAFTY